MRILVLSQFFPPEMGAPAARFYDFGRHWVAAGHQVSVITAFPNWPNGVIPEKYRGRFYQKESIDGISVYRGFIYARARTNFLAKILGYISFMISSFLILVFTRIKCDVVVCTSPPPLVGLIGILASRMKRVPLVFDVRDIWPESAAQIGLVRNRPLIRFLQWIEMTIYRCSHIISVVTHGKIERLSSRGVPKEKIVLIRNGVDVVLFDKESRMPLPADLAEIIESKRCFTYAGVFNIGQNLDNIVDAVYYIRENAPESYDQASFILIGDGSRRDKLMAQTSELKLDRVYFVGLLPREEVYSALKHSYAVFVTLCPRPDTHTVPSKLYEALATNHPVILCAEGEPADIVRRSGGGTVCPPGNPRALAKAIQTYIENSALADSHGRAGRAYCEEFFDSRNMAEDFLNVLVDLVEWHSRKRKGFRKSS